MEGSDYYEEDGDVNRVCGRGQVTQEKGQTDEYWWECDNVCCLSAVEEKKKKRPSHYFGPYTVRWKNYLNDGKKKFPRLLAGWHVASLSLNYSQPC